MLRRITGFRADDAGAWVAELACLHGQHIRHRPPFQDRPWVTTDAGRAGRIGTDLDCPLCDRAELPGGLEVTRTAGPFDQDTLPGALRRDHVVADGRWGCLRVIEGAIGFAMETTPPVDVRLAAHMSRLRFRPRAYSYIGNVPVLDIFDKPIDTGGKPIEFELRHDLGFGGQEKIERVARDCGPVVGPDDEGHVRLREFAVDILQLEHIPHFVLDRV